MYSFTGFFCVLVVVSQISLLADPPVVTGSEPDERLLQDFGRLQGVWHHTHRGTHGRGICVVVKEVRGFEEKIIRYNESGAVRQSHLSRIKLENTDEGDVVSFALIRMNGEAVNAGRLAYGYKFTGSGDGTILWEITGRLQKRRNNFENQNLIPWRRVVKDPLSGEFYSSDTDDAVAHVGAGNSPSLLVMNQDGKGVRTICVQRNAKFLSGPRWSHDGQQIIYDAELETGRMLVSAVEGNKTEDLGVGLQPDWSADDEKLVFWTPSDYPDSGGEASIWIMRRDGSDRQKIGSGERPRWRPQHDEIGVIRNPDGGANIHRVDLVTGNEIPLLKAEYERVIAMNYSMSGDEIVYVAKRLNGDIVVAAVNAEGEASGHRILREGGELNENAVSLPSWSPDKTKLLGFVQATAGQTLVEFDIKSGNTRRLPPIDGVAVVDPDWSPDGKRIACVSTWQFTH